MKTYKVWLVVTLVFLAGVASGAFTTRVLTRRIVRGALAHPEWVQGRIERDLHRKLRLDSRQDAEVHQVLIQSRTQLKDLRRDFEPRLRQVLSETRRQIDAVLDPTQKQQFDKYLADYPLPALTAAETPRPVQK
jgi:hypothetical protein